MRYIFLTVIALTLLFASGAAASTYWWDDYGSYGSYGDRRYVYGDTYYDYNYQRDRYELDEEYDVVAAICRTSTCYPYMPNRLRYPVVVVNDGYPYGRADHYPRYRSYQRYGGSYGNYYDRYDYRYRDYGYGNTIDYHYQDPVLYPDGGMGYNRYY